MSSRTLRRKVKNFTEDLAEEIAYDKRVEAASKEVRRRWADARDILADAADTVSDKAEDFAGVAEDKFDQARKTAVPAAKRLGKRAAAEVPDLDRVQSRVADAGGVLGANLIRMGTDLADASRGEADRVIQAIQEEAERTRLETTEAERKSRVKALVGWTIFGMVAGALIANRMGAGQAEAVDTPVLEDRTDRVSEGSDAAAPDAAQPTGP